MMNHLFAFLSLVAVCAAILPLDTDTKYHGAQVFRITPETAREVTNLRQLYNNNEFDFWTDPLMPGKPVDIMVSRWEVSLFKEAMRKDNISYEVMIPDLYQSLVEHRRENEEALRKGRESGKKMDWTAYHDYDDIMEWVDSLATTYPSLVTVENVGQSYEGRTMKLVKVSTGGDGQKPAIFCDGGIHAREWISPATLTYIMNELLSNQETFSDVLDAVDFYFMPSINPDGYSYSWTNERYWRKTRSPSDISSCMGVDANRNWDFHWMESGASSRPCADTYAGPEAFSEVETQIVRDQMMKYSPQAKVYLTFHSYGQYWMYPWGYDRSLPEDWEELDALAHSAVDALTDVYGTKYTIGSSGRVLYPAAGASDDYAKGPANIKYSYTVELRDKGRYGFNLPASQIIPTGTETFAAFQVIMDYVKDNYAKK